MTKKKWRFVFWTALGLAFAIPPLIPDKPKPGYMAPRFPREVFSQPNEAELKQIGRYIAHQTSGDMRLGTIRSGLKALIVLSNRRQDMRLLKAVIGAMKERHIEVDYIFEDDLLSEALGVPKGRVAGAFGGGQSGGTADLLKELRARELDLGPWPRFLPAELRAKIRKAMGERGQAGAAAPPESDDSTRVTALQEAMRRYVVDLHPEYGAIVGGRPRQEYMTQNVGPKWISLWNYAAVRDFQIVSMNYPSDVWRLTEDKIMQTIPWIEDVHIYDPEGTDIRFSVTPQEAEVWAKAAYQPSHIFLNPLQGTRAVYFREGLRDVIVPKSNGVVAGTVVGGGRNGVFPHMEIHVKDGLVTHIEGGGRLKEIWDAYLSNEQLSNAQPPHFPHKGFIYFYEVSFGTNPKYLATNTGTGAGQRSGVFHWGFGLEHGNPEIVQYLREHNLPNDHNDRFLTYFSTYEIKLRGKNQGVKFVNGGRLNFLDDPEVRALASRYGDPDEILRERWVPDIPGINAPGDYFRDYAHDPAPHIAKMTQQVLDGTYPYLK
ncbi:MAG: hypothetical protein HY315_03260 [Acidobacteria bacterium]|nr:hypothetical protein [Acidobacteriota bacterium]